jgi:hypothetical protein
MEKFAIFLYVAVVRAANSEGNDLVYRLHVKAFFTFIMSYDFTVKVKVKFTVEQATKAQKGSRCIALNTFFNIGARWGWVVNVIPRLL